MTATDPRAALGPYFAVRTDASPPPGFRPLPELSAADGPLAARIAEVGRVLGTGEPRVAASTAHLGLAARLWSVALGAALATGRVPELDGAWFALPPQGPFDLWLPSAPGREATAEALEATVLTGQLAPLAGAVRAVTPLAPGLLAGNAASALVGAARQAATVPAFRAPAAALARALLARPALAATGTVSAPGRPLAFRRASCCLYYRTPSGGLCGDCVFTRAPRR
ncbi:FhuF-like iron-sulfur protein [Kitasatospora sp. SolWspMP-SS2h]|uniref:(2Fe-2S)-binding protein n=1 Tax=Kitasatospora sp. SolWspMP-SS2h TaxID=1305729 RepID=UPI000DB9616F|nr:(2Fe-2S)-binding protein [Kitasatospora sp. SolWspMP-SS2h]RAJ44654.1 FhuF-like iron-sulfur protein [Kitasatospora sp. SolWspMP-SS2h]